MQNHCVCLANIPTMEEVHVIGYTESPLFKELADASNVKVHRIRPFINLPRVLFPLYAPLKILWLLFQLLVLLFTLPKFDLILAQNPPSMPTVPFCWLLNLFKGKRFVIDWHNLGYSLLKVHKTPKIVTKIAEILEFFFGRMANGHITVTKALKQFLHEKGIESAVVYDRPSELFTPSRAKRTEFAKKLDIDPSDIWLMTSTSWTPDEEIEMLLRAADKLDSKLTQGLSIIITGKGPMRRWFESEVKSRQFSNITFYFQFFEKYEEYAEFLGCCDIGVSLHVSSSGIDLPMKGLDMIGAGLPLLSVSYQCIDELVDDGVNGLLFRDSDELAEVLTKLIITKDVSLEKLREGSIESSKQKWNDVWESCSAPVFFAYSE